MKQVAKYNTYKGVSTVLTVGTPIATLACCGDMFIHRSETAISAAAVFAFLISMLFVKDKLLEFLKSPSALKVAVIGLIMCILIQNLLIPLEWVFGMTIAATAVDELTFKRLYSRLLLTMPDTWKQYEHFGFLFCKTDTLLNKEVAHE